MSAALKQLSKLRCLLSPSFYKTQYLQMCDRYHHQYITKGSAQPLFNVMILTGLLGYSVEWLWVGRHHVAHKREIVEKALKESGHH